MTNSVKSMGCTILVVSNGYLVMAQQPSGTPSVMADAMFVATLDELFAWMRSSLAGHAKGPTR